MSPDLPRTFPGPSPDLPPKGTHWEDVGRMSGESREDVGRMSGGCREDVGRMSGGCREDVGGKSHITVPCGRLRNHHLAPVSTPRDTVQPTTTAPALWSSFGRREDPTGCRGDPMTWVHRTHDHRATTPPRAALGREKRLPTTIGPPHHPVRPSRGRKGYRGPAFRELIFLSR